MSKITAEQLERSAIVYVRQSTAFQVVNNIESGRRQYGLVERARQLGWTDVQVIDDDLGRSGGGIVRPGFEKLLAAICERRVGAVLSIEASRLARNGRDWHTLLEFCGLVGTLIVDEDGVYDPRSINDRLLLGMKGTMSEMEVSVFRQRSMEAMKQKARRGERFLTVAVGYTKTGDDRIEMDPDRRVREAIALVFRKFAELQTVRQVLVWIRQQQIVLPAIVQGSGMRPVEWKTPRVPYVPSYIDESGVRRSLCIRTPRGAHDDRGRPQAGGARHSPGSGCMGGFDQGPPRWLHLVAGVRKESAPDRRQRQWQELSRTRLDPPGRRSAAWPLPLRAVRQEVAGILWRLEVILAALRVPWCVQRARRDELHQLRRHAD